MSESNIKIRCGQENRLFPQDTPLDEIIRAFPGGNESAVIGAKVNGMPRDLHEAVGGDAEVELLTFATRDGKEMYRHSSAHILAQAVKTLFPSAKLAIGPPIDEGFYYDIAFERPFGPDDLERIEKKMREIIQADLPVRKEVLSKEESIRLFRSKGEDYKVEIIEGIPDGDSISVYRQGDFVDLCRGPHLRSTGKVGAIKLLSTAGAYWRGDEHNPMLQRIYGTSFTTEEALKAHLDRLEEIKRRDHRRLGKELDLFSISDDLGGGLILWHPRGALIRKTIEDFWREEHVKSGYDLVYSPHIARLDLWKQSGHLDFYRENMYAPMTVETVDYQLKPMNCPFHIIIYRSHLRSYRDLPLRYAELGTVYRFERSGVLHGLMRVRGFTQDDAHLFCRPDQVEDEILKVLDFTLFILRTFGFESYEIFLSTRPEKYVGTPEHWESATAALESALKKHGLSFEVDPGEGVFYGPKIDLKIRDVLGRSWQCATIQVDFNLPERFDIHFIGEDGQAHRPIMIHRALMGSIERFFGVLVEHYAGAFPMWLSPVQVQVIPITDKQAAYGESLLSRLKEAGIRAELDRRSEKLGMKIRDAQMQKIPVMLIVGAREADAGTVSVRRRSGEDLGSTPLDTLIASTLEEIRNRR